MSVQIFQPGFMPRPWLAKRERVQRSYRSLWDGLIVAAPWWEAGPPIELISERRFRWDVTPTTFTMGSSGRGAVYDAAGDSVSMILPSNLQGTPFPLTVAWYGWGTGTASANFANFFGMMYGSPVSSPFFIAALANRADTIARGLCNRAGSRDENLIGGSTPNIGSGVARPTLFIVTFTNGGFRYYIDNVTQVENDARAAGNPNYTGTDTIMFGTWNTENGNSIHLAGYIWNRELTFEERTLLWLDPLGLVRPEPQLWMPMNMRGPLLVGDPNIYAPMPVFFS